PYRTSCDEPVVFVPHDPEPTGKLALPEEVRGKILIDTIHDGDVIPGELLVDRNGKRIPEEVFGRSYELERDWGASLVAGELARHLGLGGHWRVQIARVVMDFGRFPGITPND